MPMFILHEIIQSIHFQTIASLFITDKSQEKGAKQIKLNQRY
jgi:hypothetical protein